MQMNEPRTNAKCDCFRCSGAESSLHVICQAYNNMLVTPTATLPLLIWSNQECVKARFTSSSEGLLVLQPDSFG